MIGPDKTTRSRFIAVPWYELCGTNSTDHLAEVFSADRSRKRILTTLYSAKR